MVNNDMYIWIMDYFIFMVDGKKGELIGHKLSLGHGRGRA